MLASGASFDRYRIEALLGEGGMGEVYLAHDTKLQRRVALKILRGEDEETGRDPAGHAERLLREARAAAALDHPNVVAIYDVGEVDGTAFLAMELIEGRSLRRLVGRDVPLERRIGWLVDVARALALAHHRGLIHRDVKPENVMVRRDGVVKVLDFGIARRARTIDPGEVDTGGAKLGPESRLVGTPRYMAPEQILAQSLDGRVDQFAWGVVAYELLSGGRMPWPSKPSLVALVGDILGRPPDPLDVPGLPDGVEAAVMRALEPSPRDRFATMDRLLEELGITDSRPVLEEDGSSLGSIALASTRPMATEAESGRTQDAGTVSLSMAQEERGAAPLRPARRRRMLAIAGLLGIASAIAVPLVWRAVREPHGAPAGPSAGPRALAVLRFEDLGERPETRWMGDAVLEMLTSDLGASGDLRVISTDQVTQAKHELALARGDLDASTLARVGKRLGTDLVVAGAYLSAGGKVRLDVRMRDVETGETVAAVSESGVEADLIDIVGRAGTALRRKLHAAELSKEQASDLRESVPASPAGLRAYARGLDRLRAFDAVAAKESFDELVATEPSFAPGHAALAEALGLLGNSRMASDEAQRAIELAGNLPRRERLAIEARYDETVEDWTKAIDAYQALHDAFPRDFEYGLHLAQVLTQGKRAEEALTVLADLRTRPPPLGTDPRIDLAAAEARWSQGDVRAAGELARTARTKAEAIGARTVVVDALKTEATGLLSTGDTAGGRAKLAEAKALAAEMGSLWEQAEIANTLGIRDLIIDDPGAGIVDLTEAERLYQAAGNPTYALNARVNRSVDYLRLARLDDAEKDALDATASREPFVTASARSTLAWIDLLRGDTRSAQALLVPARETFREAHDERMEAWTDALLGEVALVEGRLDDAEALGRESREKRARFGLENFVAESSFLLARVALARHHFDEAERLATEAADGHARVSQPSAEAVARAYVVRIRLGRDAKADVAGPLARAELLASRCPQPAARIEVSIASALAAASRGDLPGARVSLDASTAEASRLGLVRLSRDARAQRAAVDARASRSMP